MTNRKDQPPKFDFTLVKGEDGHWIQPEPDVYLTLILKHYNENGSISAVTRFFRMSDIHQVEAVNGFLYLKKHFSTHDQSSYYPLSEVIRFDINSPSKAYHETMEKWVDLEFGIDYQTWLDSKKTEQDTLMRRSAIDFLEMATGYKFLEDDND